MIENLKKKVFHLFLGISLKRRLFITYLLLTGKCGTLDQYFFGCSIKKHGSKHEYQRTEQQICNKKPAFQTDS